MYSLCCMLVLVMVFAFYVQIPIWLLYSPMGAQLLWFVMPQPNGLYPWQVYVLPGDGLWLIPGVH